MSYDLMVSYDSFKLQHLISPRSLLMIADIKAQTLHFSEAAVISAKEPKELSTIEGKNRFNLYNSLTKASSKLIDFFKKCLQ